MEEKGLIVKDNGPTVVIRTERTTACDSCATKSACYSASSTEALIEADNPVGAHLGDKVVFTVSAGSVVKAGLLLYLVPILSFIAGVVIGQTAGKRIFTSMNSDLSSAIFGVAFLAAAFFGLKLYGGRAARQSAFRPIVVRVV